VVGKKSKDRLMHGVGINDVDYVVRENKTIGYINGKQKQITVWLCPYYLKWSDALRRCYSEKYQAKSPTYVGCSVDPDWLYLSNFIKWVDSQPNRDWQNCQLDKDLLVEDNKHYSPDTCVFISKGLNVFIVDRGAARGKYLIGVSWHKAAGKFVAQCNNPFKTRAHYIGCFNTELEAHKAWQERKHLYACQLAELQSDHRVANALRTRYSPDKDWTKR
jgi:hypothetical protein